MTDPRALEDLRERVPAWAGNILLAGYRGSDAHGTKLPEDHPAATDDVDTWAICVQPPGWYVGLGGYTGTTRTHWSTAGDHYDHLVFDVRKFCALVLAGNPNSLGWLWTHPQDLLVVTEAGRSLLRLRDDLLSKRVVTATGGYARDQMRRMERDVYRGYQGEKRRKLVERYGYDVKHASHCVRLLWLGLEILRDRTMHARRPPGEREVLKQIKAGEWKWKDIRRHIELLEADFVREAERCTLPETADEAQVDRILQELILNQE